MKQFLTKFLPALLLGVFILGATGTTASAEDLTPDQQEITDVLKKWGRAWTSQSVSSMREIYDHSTGEWNWVESNLRKKRKSRVKVSVGEIVVFGDEAFAKMRVSPWKKNYLASLIKEDGQWKLQFRTTIK